MSSTPQEEEGVGFRFDGLSAPDRPMVLPDRPVVLSESTPRRAISSLAAFGDALSPLPEPMVFPGHGHGSADALGVDLQPPVPPPPPDPQVVMTPQGAPPQRTDTSESRAARLAPSVGHFMQITVALSDGYSFLLPQVDGEASVVEVKRLAFEHLRGLGYPYTTKVPSLGSLRITHGGRVMLDDWLIRDCGIEGVIQMEIVPLFGSLQQDVSTRDVLRQMQAMSPGPSQQPRQQHPQQLQQGAYSFLDVSGVPGALRSVDTSIRSGFLDFSAGFSEATAAEGGSFALPSIDTAHAVAGNTTIESMEVDGELAARHAHPLEKQFHDALEAFLERGASRTDAPDIHSLVSDGLDGRPLAEALTAITDGLLRELGQAARARDLAARHPKQHPWVQIERLRKERDTWSLIQRMCSFHLEELDAAEIAHDEDAIPPDATEDEIEGHLSQHDRTLKLYKVVTEWLEDAYSDPTYAREDLEMSRMVTESLEDAYLDPIDAQDDLTVGRDENWHATTKRLKRSGARPSMDGVDSVDPDGPYQSSAIPSNGTPSYTPLDPEDEEVELKLMLGVWQLLRAGSLESAIDLCLRKGQQWRAAILGGGAYSKVQKQPNGVCNRLGQPRMALWRRMCRASARKMLSGDHARGFQSMNTRRGRILTTPSVEGTVLSILGLDLNLALTSPLVKGKWEHHCWIYFKMMVDQHVDEALAKHRARQQQLSKLYPHVSGNVAQDLRAAEDLRGLASLDVLEVFERLEESSMEKVRKASASAIHRTQKAFILGSGAIVDLLHGLASECEAPTTKAENPWLLCFAAHVALLARMALSHDEVPGYQCDALLLGYAKGLIESQQTSLVATYVSLLPKQIRLRTYVDLMKVLVHTGERRKALEAAFRWFPSEVPDMIVLAVAELCRSPERAMTGPSAAQLPALAQKAGVRLEDFIRVQALEWFFLAQDNMQTVGPVLDFSPALEAVHAGNCILRKLFLHASDAHEPGDTSAVSAEGIAAAILLERRFTGRLELDETAVSTQREHAHWRNFLKAHEAFLAWRMTLSQGKAVGALGASSFDMAMESVGEAASAVAQEANEARDAILDVFKCAGGWLNANPEMFAGLNKMRDRRRELSEKEAQALRRACLPQLAFMLHSVLHETAQWAKENPEAGMPSASWFRQALEATTTLAGEELVKLVDEGETGAGFITKLLVHLQDSAMELVRLGAL